MAAHYANHPLILVATCSVAIARILTLHGSTLCQPPSYTRCHLLCSHSPYTDTAWQHTMPTTLLY
ncbi:hypothetical protein GDO81_004431 [Engystomops pustulosus]|uniref:Secreted protein n=1 Tax=Engystomops pustulosus TaxID=76066 RepID=A0AAV6ZS01_ENGPU|nr:hypothetical protein GDO81_004431 [Engystomops pustulosus]